MIRPPDGAPPFIYITQNDILGGKPKKLKEDDISICTCKNDENNAESACGVDCWNVITSTECTPGYCPCGDSCKNQRFQKCEYAKTKLFKTEGRGWGLLADEKIKAGQFIIEYCGEVISTDEATKRSEAYESQGMKDAYIISLTANKFIDATAKGSLARFINHSCKPNCETRKWTVLGEIRVGIFAMEDIDIGMELTYNYNFEWYGGANVRCLCGAPNCTKFLGAKSPGFQEYNHVWEEGDERYPVEEIPTYDSSDDEPSLKLHGNGSSSGAEVPSKSKNKDTLVETVSSVPLRAPTNKGKAEVSGEKNSSQGTQKPFSAKRETISASGPSFQAGSGSVPKKKSSANQRKKKNAGRKPVDGKRAAQLFTSKAAREEILRCEEQRAEAEARLNAVYDEIRPAIIAHERDSQENVDTDIALKWVNPYCANLKADFNLSYSIIKNFLCPPPPESASASAPGEAATSEAAGNEGNVKK